MRPYKITLDESNGVWIDLDSVLAIHDPMVPSRNHEMKDHPGVVAMFPPFAFAIVLAFQDKVKMVETFEKNDGGIDRMINEHAAFVQAWKAK